jgi:hypothetical protein
MYVRETVHERSLPSGLPVKALAMNVFDIRGDGLRTIDREHPADDSHSVVVDPATHRVFFPLLRGPMMRIMRPK